MEDFALKNVFEKVFALVELQLHSKNIEIIKNIDDSTIFGSKNEFMQVIINIINNSKDEFEKNSSEHKYIFIDVKKSKNKVLVKIKDNAGGIETQVIDKIFEPYFTTKDELKGTGIGLYMSKQIIEKHMNGKIDVSNQHYVYNDIECRGAIFEMSFLQKTDKL